MIRACKIFLFCALAQLVVPVPAHAFSWFWLDNLSGPGPFVGVEWDQRLWCFGGSPSDLAGKSPCPHRIKEHKQSINLIAAYAISTHNELPYADSTADRHVQLFRLGPSFSWAFEERSVEVNVGVEWNYFATTGTDVKNFSRLAVPVAIDFMPFVQNKAVLTGDWRDKLAIRIGFTVFPMGFDARDFGAVPGSYHKSVDVVPNLGLVWDFGARR